MAKEKSIPATVYIYSTYNNTIIHLVDMAGDTIAQVSGGKITKHSRLKATPTVAMFAAKRIAEAAKENGIDSVYVRISSKAGATTTGPGAHAAVKSLARDCLLYTSPSPRDS